MPSIDIEWLNDNLQVENITAQYPVFVESGTYMGETIIPLEKEFSELHTIEIKREFYDHVVSNYNKYKGKSPKQIKFHFGDSSKMLLEICPNIESNSIFFLDGHWSAGNTGKGDKDCPIYEELRSIMAAMKHRCIIIVDDCRLFGMGPNVGNEICNWEDINSTEILNLVDSRLNKYHFSPSNLNEKDRMVIFIDEQ